MDGPHVTESLTFDVVYGIVQPLADLGALEVVEEPLHVGSGHTTITAARPTPLGLWAIGRLAERTR
ncbi:MAG: hypothetical protein ACYDCC_09000 [Actinomycetota bacterium]